jgi:hypothetical protein
MHTDRIITRDRFLETSEKKVTWILVVSLIMLFGSMYFYNLWPFPSYSYTATRDVWYYLLIAAHLFFTLTLGASALCLASFAKKWTYYASVFCFTISIVLLAVQGLRPLF